MKYPTYKLSEVARSTKGKKPKSVSKEKTDGFEIPYVDIKAFEKGIVDNYTDGENCTFCKPDDVLIVWDGARCGFVGRGVEGAIGSTLAKISSEKYTNDFLFYFLQSKYKVLNSNPRGVGIPHIEPNLLWNFEIPDVDKTTQRAIVSRIETLFAELDKAVQHLHTAQQQLKTYRQAVLRNAFEGNLTKEWRNHNHISHETWEEKEFSSIAEIKSNLVDVADYKDYPHIAPDNIEKETGKLLEYHTIAEDGVISGKHRFFAGQILYSKIRPNLSKVIIVDFDGLCSADMYPIEAKGNTKFLWYQMLSDRFVDYASNSGSRTVLPKINQKGLSIIPMKICSIEEQNEVVIQIESRLSQATASETYIENALQQAEALRQSILKKAFSGELV